MPWCVINITTKPHQHLTIIPEGTQQIYHLEKRSFAPAANLGKTTPGSLQRPSWTGGFCSVPGISPDLEHFAAKGYREQLQSLGTAAGNILPAQPCLFCKGLQQKCFCWWWMWQRDRERLQLRSSGCRGNRLFLQTWFPLFLSRNKMLYLAPAYVLLQLCMLALRLKVLGELGDDVGIQQKSLCILSRGRWLRLIQQWASPKDMNSWMRSPANDTMQPQLFRLLPQSKVSLNASDALLQLQRNKPLLERWIVSAELQCYTHK